MNENCTLNVNLQFFCRKKNHITVEQVSLLDFSGDENMEERKHL